MTLDELIADYRKQTSITYKLDYSDKKAVKANNAAVKRMYAIIEEIKSRFGIKGIETFADLLEYSVDKTQLWAAAHLLERTSPDDKIKNKALKIIKEIANSNEPESLGFQMWLKDYHKR